MTIIGQLRKAVVEFCKDYCKYHEEIERCSDDEYKKLYAKYCDSCPLKKI